MQVSHFKNNTYFTPPSKGGALGATRLASPANTQRVGNSPTATAKTTAQLLLELFTRSVSTPGEQKGAFSALFGNPIETILLTELRKQIDSGEAFKLEAKVLKRLLALVPEQLKEGYVSDFYRLRRKNAIAVGTFKPGQDEEFLDPVVKYLTRLVTRKRTKGNKAQQTSE
jgi:hypothetical protein